MISRQLIDKIWSHQRAAESLIKTRLVGTTLITTNWFQQTQQNYFEQNKCCYFGGNSKSIQYSDWCVKDAFIIQMCEVVLYTEALVTTVFLFAIKHYRSFISDNWFSHLYISFRDVFVWHLLSNVGLIE